MHEGLFRYKGLIYGVSSAFESFQKQIEIVISGCPGSKNISDDILIWGSSEQEHNRHLVIVLTCLDETGLKVNREKCMFGANHIVFAGHELSAEGIAPQKSRVEAIQNMKAPSNASEVILRNGKIFATSTSKITLPSLRPCGCSPRKGKGSFGAVHNRTHWKP